MWYFVLRRHWRWIAAALGSVLTVVLIALAIHGESTFGITLLGHIDTPRAAAGGPSGVTLPRSSEANQLPNTQPNTATSLFDQPIAADSAPLTIAAAQATWNAETIQQHQDALLSTINCSRQRQGQHALTLDPTLTTTAGTAWLKLSHDHSFSLMNLPGPYAVRSVLPLNTGIPASEEVSTASARRTPASCAVDGFDATTLPDAPEATRIGIAVFPPQAAWDMPSAVILIR